MNFATLVAACRRLSALWDSWSKSTVPLEVINFWLRWLWFPAAGRLLSRRSHVPFFFCISGRSSPNCFL